MHASLLPRWTFQLPKWTFALVLPLWFAAPAFADSPRNLSARLDRLEKSVARVQSTVAAVRVAQLYNQPQYSQPQYSQPQYDQPPADVPGGNSGSAYGEGQDAATLDVRVDRLENEVRTLNGQIQQMQFDIQRLNDQLRKFQQDVDFRFQGIGHPGASAGIPQRHSENDSPNTPPNAPPGAQSATTFGAPGPGTRGDDAFNPAANPNAPGAPRTLGTLRQDGGSEGSTVNPTIIAAPSAAGGSLPQGPIDSANRDPNAPLELPSAPHLNSGSISAATSSSAVTPSTSATPPSANLGPANAGMAAAPGTAATPLAGARVASLPPSTTPREDFDAATAALKNGQYATAEKGLKAFIGKYPNNKLLPEAIFDLGETYFVRNRFREAAEQYLKISANYSTAAKAPDSLLRLGESLDKLGAKEQACAAFAEVRRKYPKASPGVRAAARREAKHVQC